MKVSKRDGHTVTYDRAKIVTAIKKANAEVEPCEKVSDEKIEEIVSGIEAKNKQRMLVEDIQDHQQANRQADLQPGVPVDDKAKPKKKRVTQEAAQYRQKGHESSGNIDNQQVEKKFRR